MTGRTHDLAAFTALNFVFVTEPLASISIPTALVAIGANMIGGIAPDIDQPTAKLWNRLPGGFIFGRVFTPLFGGHRLISHSILGIILFGWAVSVLLTILHSFLLVDMRIVWWAFMIGFVSHLVMDTFTKEGVPWLFPIPICFGIPPLGFLRIKTAGLFEKSIIFPLLMVINLYLVYLYYPKYLEFFHLYIK